MNETPAQLQQRYELILNCAGEGIYGLDHAGNATFVNPAAVEITGWASDDIIGKPMHEMLRHKKADSTPYPLEECPIYAALRDGAVHCTDDEVFWRRDGAISLDDYLSVSAWLLRVERLSGFVAIDE